jgi:hypothetical protein
MRIRIPNTETYRYRTFVCMCPDEYGKIATGSESNNGSAVPVLVTYIADLHFMEIRVGYTAASNCTSCYALLDTRVVTLHLDGYLTYGRFSYYSMSLPPFSNDIQKNLGEIFFNCF